MTRKNVLRIVAILIALMMVPAVLDAAVGNRPAQAAVTQSQIDSLKKQQKEYEQKKQELQAQINSLEYEQYTALQKKMVLDEQIQLTQQQIALIGEQIEKYDTLIVQKSADVQEAQLMEDTCWAQYKANMRSMEENGAIAYISVVFQADSFTDMLSRINDVGEIMNYQQKLYEQLQASKQATVGARDALEAAKAGQEADKADMEEKKDDLLKQVDEAAALLSEIKEDLDAAKDLYEQENKEAAAIQAEINKKVKELQSQQVTGTGALTWPAPSCNIVTSKFGNRYHPIYHEYRMHYGVDIGAAYGADIVAADSGTVITSTYSSSYGNYIVVSHGNGMTTLYAHLSSRLVKEGATVKKSQVIGKCGSTGASTGPHLHFEVSVNGTRVNPLKYYNNYTIQ